MPDYATKYFKCPFYEKEGEKTIKCEGTFSEFCIFAFRSKDKKEKYERDFCKSNYKNCPHSKKLFEKYPT